MKLGWLVWEYEGDDAPTFYYFAPDWCFKKIQIVYAEVTQANVERAI